MSLRANLTLLLVCAAMPAQVTEKTLNNTDVANMIKAGLPEGTNRADSQLHSHSSDHSTL